MRFSISTLVLGLSCLALIGCGSKRGADESATSKAQASVTALPSGDFSVDNLENHIRYLASDELEGRAPGSKGEERTLVYLTETYANLGLRPGNPNGMYVQEVPLMASTVTNTPSLHLHAGSRDIDLEYTDDFMGWTLRQKERSRFRDAPLVFVGYGIVAPEYNWDDYKGVDVRDKVIVMLVGDPPLPDSTMFGGTAMTYYGRWTYKFEIAAKKGAAGAIIVHNEGAAGYPWSVVANSWSGEQFDVVRENEGSDRCKLESWITESAAKNVFSAAGMQLRDAYREALSPAFRPIPLDMSADVDIVKKSRRIRSHNVVALVEGADPEYRSEYIIYTAHWDHLGKGNPIDGDDIYNGALDNASGVAATLELARAFVEHRDRLKRSILIINTTAEESGLLGSYHYARNPLYPLARTVATINIDGLNIWGRTRDMVIVGYGYSDLDDYLDRAVSAQDRYTKPDTEPEKGYYYRSDHFPFAQRGVPSLYADSGIEYLDRPADWGKKVKQAYTRERYHKPQDEFDDTWDLTGAVEDLEAYFQVGLMIASSSTYPEWNAKSEFKDVRDASLKAAR